MGAIRGISRRHSESHPRRSRDALTRKPASSTQKKAPINRSALRVKTRGGFWRECLLEPVADRVYQRALCIVTAELPEERATQVLCLHVAHLLGDHGRRVVAPERVAVVLPGRTRIGIGVDGARAVLEHLEVLVAGFIRAGRRGAALVQAVVD